ncbi:hypothetical protein ACIBH1_38645 [Nonomuraea sp. NPDC050663]|uniref:hypothetical protein n=1 Tax=Nonomuraea sp. NPDC050663 TaxID=3364370 RepID=UPI001818F72A|nr:hypothetical protein [Thermoactinospora sp.]
MFKKIVIGLVAAAAATAMAASVPAAASATTVPSDYHSDWGYYYAKHYLAKAKGHISVDWYDHHSNTTEVSGKLYDLDPRKYSQGGKCAYVKFQVNYLGDDHHEWEQVYSKKYCGYPGYKSFHFEEDDVRSVRVKVCQTDKHGNYFTKCSKWNYLYDYEAV